ncbi:hypothetical protein WJX75_005177 [Coccomyxa subellipsoidea]|uniref:Chromo domain-containing protein n=1 Tax=Coccomyxa subellipsoidea TaxID=248742 RepID=A0ABR2YTT4_9CHLO
MGSAFSRKTAESLEEDNEGLPVTGTPAGTADTAVQNAAHTEQATNATLQQQTHSAQKGASPPHLPVQQKTPPTNAKPQVESPISPLKSDGQPRRHMSMVELSGVPQTPLPTAAAPSAKKGAPSLETPAYVAMTKPKRKRVSSTATMAAGMNSSQKKRRPSTWSYVGLQYLQVADNDGRKRAGWVECPDGRCYPRTVTFKKGDVPLHVYAKQEYNNNVEYEVEAILDERRRGPTVQYRIKWKGYELDPEEFVARKALEDCEALDKWEAAQAAATSTSRQLHLMHA